MSGKDPNEIGALWLKSGGKGDYMTGTIGGMAVVCFRNEYHKDGDNKPAWRVLKSKPKDGAAPRITSSRPEPDDDMGF